jgi:hypothetical protein
VRVVLLHGLSNSSRAFDRLMPLLDGFDVTAVKLLTGAVAVMLGTIAVLTKVCTGRLEVGGWHALLTVPAPYLLVALAIAVTVVQQSAFRAGALQASVPVMLVGEPIVAVLIGVVVLGEQLSVHGSSAPLLAVAVGAMTTATIALGRGTSSRTRQSNFTAQWTSRRECSDGDEVPEAVAPL